MSTPPRIFGKFLGVSKAEFFKRKIRGTFFGRERWGVFKPKRPFLGGTEGYRYFLQQHIALVGLTYMYG